MSEDDLRIDPALAARQWLLRRVDLRFTEGIRDLLRLVTEELSVATGDAASVRALSEDGQWLFPMTANHPDPALQAAMQATMDVSVQRADSGLWQRVFDEEQTVQWPVEPGRFPADASAQQIQFLRRFPVRRIMAMPLVSGERVVGGASLVRYITDRPFSESDVTLLRDFGERAALALDALRMLNDLSGSGGPSRA